MMYFSFYGVGSRTREGMLKIIVKMGWQGRIVVRCNKIRNKLKTKVIVEEVSEVDEKI